MRNILRIGVIGLSAVAFIGCGTDNPSKSSAAPMTDTERAAYAASHAYPTSQPSSDLHLAALVSPDRSTLKIYNFSNKPLGEVDVWVNRTYLVHVRSLTPNGSVSIRTADLYNAFGKNFSSQADPMSSVQVLADGVFYNVWGPVTQ